jgi:uncharacterized membrane protein required for colicin V production
MHWLDISILVVLGIGAAMGFWSGLLWQVARVVSLAVSIYLAILANTPLAEWSGRHWPDVNPAVSRVVGFVAVFVLAYLILYLLTRGLHNAIKAARLETLDRVLGGLLGALKMAALAACICGLLSALEVGRDWFAQAPIARQFAQGTESAIAWIPQSSRDRLDEGVQQVRNELQQRITDAAVDTLKGDAAKK